MERYLVVAIEALQPRPAAGPTGDVSQPGVAGVCDELQVVVVALQPSFGRGKRRRMCQPKNRKDERQSLPPPLSLSR